MEKFKLTLDPRGTKKPNQLRREGHIPATVYGPGKPSFSAMVSGKDFSRLPASAFSHIIELEGAKEGKISAIIRNVQRKSTTNDVLNIEFYRTQADRKLTVTVPLKFIGVSPAVQAGGQLLEIHQEVEIECFPQDIPDYLEVDIAQIQELEQGIHFGDLPVSSTIKVLNPADETIVRVVAPRAVGAEEKPAATEATSETPASP